MLALLMAILTIPAASAQPSVRPAVVSGTGVLIRDGLVLDGWDYYRSAWSADSIELRMAAGRWTAPKAGERVDDSRVWTPVAADSLGWISHPDLRGGYLYAAVNSDSGGVMLLEGMGYGLVLVNGAPRSGNVYGFKDDWESWEPRFDFSFVPIELNPGVNEFVFQGGRAPRIRARLHRPDSPLVLNVRDVTVPDLLVGEEADYWGSIALINATEETVEGLSIVAKVADHPGVQSVIPDLPPLSVRKVAFRVVHPAPTAVGAVPVTLSVLVVADGAPIETEVIMLSVKNPEDNHRRTFTSNIDGSVQYYGLNRAAEWDPSKPSALVLSVHGAAVEAINQSASYRAKTWAHIVAPTNRRPYGFNWEDWGRMDALEVLDIAEKTLNVDPSRVYLTGHSMGGHGTWHLGALYPDRFAAIGPSAGWISFWSYRPRGSLEVTNPVHRMIMRATLPSRTMELAPNYSELGVYVIHGADDDNVPAEQSRMMVDRLSSFHRDFVYHEEPDAGHWWDKSDEDGADCVDWPPLFDFFARHARAGADRIRQVDFVTPNPGVSSCHHWACVVGQSRALEMSRFSLRYDPGKNRFVGETDNVEQLVLSVPEGKARGAITLTIDGQTVTTSGPSARVWMRRTAGGWESSSEPPLAHKGPHRYGTFKDAFRNRAVLVYGTRGSPEENEWALLKARFDAEQFWYQGNGGFDVVPDSAFQPEAYSDRNVVLYGNQETNRAWEILLSGSPVRVTSGRIDVGDREWSGDDFGVLFIQPRPDSDVASVAAVSGSGLSGMKITALRPYLSAGFAYPDVVVLKAGGRVNGDIAFGAGFFGNDWTAETGEFEWIE